MISLFKHVVYYENERMVEYEVTLSIIHTDTQTDNRAITVNLAQHTETPWLRLVHI